MRLRRLSLLALLPALALPLAAQHFVVANRGAGNISVHRASDGARVRVVPLPAGAATPQPMYVVQIGDEVLVGDRGNDRVVRFSARDQSVLGTIPAGRGVFHMWAGARQLWVNNDIDDTVTVVDTGSMRVAGTVAIPADLAADGYRPHDVFVGRRLAWVSLLGGSGASDWVVQYDQRTLRERGRVAVGKDPHLWWQDRGDRLFVASQGSGEVRVMQASTLRTVSRLAVPGAHGIFMPAETRTLLVTDITGGGKGDLLALGTRPFGLRVADAIDTGRPTAHNIAASPRGHRIMVTHSGATSTRVTLYTLRFAGPPWASFAGPELERLADLEAGANPFGIAFVR